MFSIILGMKPSPKEKDGRSTIRNGLTFREPLSGLTRHVPQFDPNNNWLDRPEPDIKASRGK